MTRSEHFVYGFIGLTAVAAHIVLVGFLLVLAVPESSLVRGCVRWLSSL